MTSLRIAAACAASTSLVAGGLVMAGCGSSTTSSIPTEAEGAAYAEVNSANGDGESTLTAINGEKFVVGFNCSPGTGYSWKTKTSGDSVLVLKKKGECTPADESAGATTNGAVGRSGMQYYTYDVTSTGTEVLTFEWVGPGRDRTAEATQVVTVVAQ